MGELPKDFDRIKQQSLETPETGVRPGPKNEDLPEAPDFSDLNTENQGFFAKLGSGAKELAGWAYEKIKKTPLVGKLVGKAQIAFHEHWMNKHQEKAQGLKGRIEDTNAEIGQLDSSHAEISSALEDLKVLNSPSMRSLEEKLRKIESNKSKLEGSRDKFQGKLDTRNEKMKMRTEKRDGVVNEFIGRCNEKLEPIDKKLEGLNGLKNQADFKASMAEVRYRKQLDGLNKKQEIKTRIENALKRTGLSKLEVEEDPSLVKLNTEIIEGKKAIDKSKAEMAKERQQINKRITRASTKAKGFKDKVVEFERMKAGRPAPVSVEQPAEVVNEEQEVAANNESNPEATVEAGKEELTVKAFIKLFNDFLGDKFGNNYEPEVVDEKKFAEATKGIKELEMDSYIQFNDFKGIIPNYLKAMGVESKRIDFLLQTFYQEKIKDPTKEDKTEVKSEEVAGEEEAPEKVVPRFEQPSTKKPEAVTGQRPIEQAKEPELVVAGGNESEAGGFEPEKVEPQELEKNTRPQPEAQPEVLNPFMKKDGKLESANKPGANGFSLS